MTVLQDSRSERSSVHKVRSRQREDLRSGPRAPVSMMMMVMLVIKQEGGAHLSSQHRGRGERQPGYWCLLASKVHPIGEFQHQ